MNPAGDSFQVILWGISYCDLIFTGMPQMPALGKDIFASALEVTPGGCFTTAMALNRLGIRAGWLTDFGCDLFSKFILETALRERMDTSLFQVHDFPLRRTAVSLSFASDRGFVSYIDPVEVTALAPFLRKHRPEWLLLPHLHFGDEYQEIYAAAQELGTRILMDCQDIPCTLETPGVIQALSRVEIFAPNECEALRLTGAPDIPSALQQLRQWTPTVVIKLGAQGCLASSPQGIVHQPGLPMRVVDTTGAGDCFNTGLLYGMLRGYPLEKCLACANISGGLCVTAPGGLAAPTAHQMEALLDRPSR